MKVTEINLPLVMACLKHEAMILLDLLQRSLFLILMIKYFECLNKFCIENLQKHFKRV